MKVVLILIFQFYTIGSTNRFVIPDYLAHVI